MGVSVVPTTVWSCHGMANITRASRVRGTMIAVSPPRNRLGRTMCTPWLGAIIGGAAGSSMRRTPSENAPVALMTHLAATVCSFPVSASLNTAPLT